MRVRVIRRCNGNSFQVIHENRSCRPTISKHITITSLHNTNFHDRLRTISNRVQILLNSRNFRRLHRLTYNIQARHTTRRLQLNLQSSQRVKKARTVRRHQPRSLTPIHRNNHRRHILRQDRRNISLTSKHRDRLIINHINQRLQHRTRPQHTHKVKSIGHSQAIRAGLLNRKQRLIVTRDRTRLNRHNIQQVHRHIFRHSLTIQAINLQRHIHRLHNHTQGHMTQSNQGLNINLMFTDFRHNHHRRHFRHKSQEVRLQNNAIRRQIQLILQGHKVITIHFKHIITHRLIQIMT